MISIKGLDKAAVLAALYNRAKPLGLGMLHYTPEDMTIEEAKKELAKGTDDMGFNRHHPMYFDYCHGRVMKVDISGDEIREDLFDRGNGRGAAEEALRPLRSQ